MIPLVRSIVHAMLWDPMAVRRWLRGLAVSFSLGGVAFADQVAAVLGTPGAAKTVKVVALALAFVGASISVGQANAKPAGTLIPLEPPRPTGFARLPWLIVIAAVAAGIAWSAAARAGECVVHRSDAQLARFKAEWSAANGGAPCPETCKTYVRRGSRFVLYERCGACQVDHLCPLKCCGIDAPSNMHWMDKLANLRKGADCSACPAKP